MVSDDRRRDQNPDDPRRQVHGLLYALSRRRGSEGCQCCHRDDQNEANDTVRRLVSDRFQSGNQLPTTVGGARWRFSESATSTVYALQYHSDQWYV